MCPAFTSAGTSALPTKPLDPVTRIFIAIPIDFLRLKHKNKRCQNATQAPALGQAVEKFKTVFCYKTSVTRLSLIHQSARLLALSAQPMARHSSAGYNSLVSLSSQTARVKVLFFGRLREIVGHSEDSVELPDGAPIEALFSHYGANHPELARFRPSLVASRNQEFAAWSTPLHSGDEVAFLPPVSGG